MSRKIKLEERNRHYALNNKSKGHRNEKLMSNYSLKNFLKTVILSQYQKDNSVNENQVCYKKVTKDVLDVIMEDDFWKDTIHSYF